MKKWKVGFAAIILGTATLVGGCGADTEDLSHAALASSTGEGVELATAQFSVEGMTCGGCVVATEMAVRRVTGVASVTARYDEAAGEGHATVKYDPTRVDTEAIAAAIEKAGFTPNLEDH